MNILVFAGRLTKDPVLETYGDKMVLPFVLAVNSYNKTTDFIPCKAWNKTAETIYRYVGKGQVLGVHGQIRVDTYQDKDGSNKKSMYVLVTQIDFLGHRKQENTTTNLQNDNTVVSNYYEEYSVPTDDDLPF